MTIVLPVRGHLFTSWHAILFYSWLGQSPAVLISHILFSTASLIAKMRLNFGGGKVGALAFGFHNSVRNTQQVCFRGHWVLSGQHWLFPAFGFGEGLFNLSV
jgi:hypothetical protein